LLSRTPFELLYLQQQFSELGMLDLLLDLIIQLAQFAAQQSSSMLSSCLYEYRTFGTALSLPAVGILVKFMFSGQYLFESHQNIFFTNLSVCVSSLSTSQEFLQVSR